MRAVPLMRTPATLAAVLVLLTACGGGEPSRTWSYPTDGQTPIIRIETAGGGPIPPRHMTAANLPQFVLYGDGQVLTSDPQFNPFGADAPLASPVQSRRLTSEGIEALLEAADRAGLIADPLEFGDPVWTEAAPVTTIAINVDGGSFEQRFPEGGTVSGFEQEPEWDTVQNRLEAKEFLDRLNDLPGWLPQDSVSDVRPASIEQYSVYYGPGRAGDPVPALQWPLEPLSPAGELGCLAIDRTELERLERNPVQGLGNSDAAWDSQGSIYNISVRSVLPGEEPCA